MLAGIGENAGVVEIGDGWAVTFKVESHNHPSYVEPYQGAATGVGGHRARHHGDGRAADRGGRPAALRPRGRPRHRPGAARAWSPGVGGYGNCLGLPNIGGEVVFDPTYAGNPLVNALCVGLDAGGGPAPGVRLRRRQQDHPVRCADRARRHRRGLRAGQRDLQRRRHRRPAARSCPRVQVGDPFTEKVLIECCLELFAAGLVVGIQDLGGAGLSCATSELASAGDGGMHVELDRVPLRATGMTPAEILSSESQERMCAVVTPENVDAFLAVCAKWDIARHGDRRGHRRRPAGDHLARGDGRRRAAAHRRPRRPGLRAPGRPRRTTQDALVADAPDRLPRPAAPAELRAEILRMAASPNLCSRGVGHRPVRPLRPRQHRARRSPPTPGSSGWTRRPAAASPWRPTATPASSRSTRTPGTQLALAEAYRNVATSGAVPQAVTNCLNFGSPEDPHVMWQFAEAVRGLADGCAELGIPVTGGNVSFYNQTGSTAILPTPVVGVLGVLDDVARRVRSGFVRDGDAVLLLGTTRDELGGSEWAHVVHGHLGGRPPRGRPRRRAAARRRCSPRRPRDGLLTGAHDLSDGGLAQALVEACLVGGRGATVALPRLLDPFVALFAESAGRVLVDGGPGRRGRRRARARAAGVPVERLGTTGGAALDDRRRGGAGPGRAARGLGGHPAGAVRGPVRGGRGGPVMTGRPPSRRACMKVAFLTPREARDDRRGSTDPGRAALDAWLDGGPAPDRAVLRAAVKESLAALADARSRAQRRGSRAALRGGPVRRRSPAHPGHAAERRRDRRRAPGSRWRPAVSTGPTAVANGALCRLGGRARGGRSIPTPRPAELSTKSNLAVTLPGESVPLLVASGHADTDNRSGRRQAPAGRDSGGGAVMSAPSLPDRPGLPAVPLPRLDPEHPTEPVRAGLRRR